MNILKTLETAKENHQKLIAVLVDPDKTSTNDVKDICNRINNAAIDYLFLGGSTVSNHQTEIIAKEIQKYITIPVVLFPGDYKHLTHYADAVLLLNLISGNNPEYLIHQQVKAVPFLTKSSLEIIPTGYVLIDGGTETSTIKVTQTTPIHQQAEQQIVHTCLAGQYMGQKLLYLEAGSGATLPVGKDVVMSVYNSVNIPIIVGGGIRSLNKINEIHNAGATLVIIGTAFEKNKIF
ncbi:geranylgeranylglyceryl/heptaprenylglyceryl phosphate synthase [Wenyingzhuangia aestuarii]|uniref:geranylgeranylglyceryl/heptaprenylglyceryl phosphate synthase n=1 Tax=Wenyingzhuangia aestuarii TaxID=1647582 RepID=UPI00143B775B|nr:geranylgeranylglyceryl/heptaprenylglyceryl phosphate synthase [Wenyingzhuangia aestuarii]NJB82426.1 putative glycerol-1-phosphate prenyltransferase [Wenyingzhuangia aestuarii]